MPISANRKARKWEDQKMQIKFIDSVSFMACSLSSLTNNLAGQHKGKYKDCKSSVDWQIDIHGSQGNLCIYIFFSSH